MNKYIPGMLSLALLIMKLMLSSALPPTTEPVIHRNTGDTSNCMDDESFVHIEIKTDFFPQDTYWELIDINTNETLYSVEQGEYNLTHFIYNETLCIPRNSCYQFTIHDSFGDGLSSGNPKGYCKVSYEGIFVLETFGEIFVYKSSTYFGDGDECVLPTLPPTSTQPPSNNHFIVTITVLVCAALASAGFILLCKSSSPSPSPTSPPVIEEQQQITLEEEKHNRRFKILTSIIHKKVLSKRKDAENNEEDSSGELVLPHEKELSSRTMAVTKTPSSWSIYSNNDEDLEQTAEAYHLSSIFPIAVPRSKDNTSNMLKDDIYLASFRKSKKILKVKQQIILIFTKKLSYLFG
mmetsp:Transcript_13349/g.20231  ORF Transcript_13349/g.20231 Transcript_13349/m.20231 type:complete len:350 (+) Transcript_13349:58-1107(+)